MNKGIVLFVLWVLFPMAILILLFGIRYLKNKENMALIERGKSPGMDTDRGTLLTWGIVLIGASLGLIAGMIIRAKILPETEPVILYLTTVCFFTGSGLIVAYTMHRRKNNDRNGL